MIREKGMGRTRLGRFALITVPAVVASAGLGLAVVEGMVAATLSSANGFQLSTPSLTTNGLDLRPGATQAGTNSNNVATALAVTGSTTTLNTLCLGVKQAMPSVVSSVLPAVGLKISSTDTAVSVPNTALNASTLVAAGGASLGSGGSVVAGEAQSGGDMPTSATWQDTNSGYSPTGFGLHATGTNTLSTLRANAYAVTLSGLTLTNLGIGISADPQNVGTAASPATTPDLCF